MPDTRPPITLHHARLRAASHGPDQPPPDPWVVVAQPDPEVIVARAGERIERLREAWRELRYERFLPEAWQAQLHRFATALDELARPGRLGAVVLDLLREHGLAEPEPDGRWRLTGPARPYELTRSLLLRHPAFVTEVALNSRMYHHLPAVLRGERDPLELLSRDGGGELTRQLYDIAPLCRFANQVAGALLDEIVAAWPPDRPLRVLEVGAGTGGTTAALLPRLPSDRTRYTFTDVWPFFCTAARRRFAAHDFLDYRQLDLNADPAAQGFAAGGYDVVVAANALHTARDLAPALRRIGRLLAPGGHLLAVETHDPRLLIGTFGLLESFWQVDDRDLRPHGLLLSRDRWPSLLRECGFAQVVQTGDDRPPARDGFSVMLASHPPSTEARRQPLPAPATEAGRPPLPPPTTETGHPPLLTSTTEARRRLLPAAAGDTRWVVAAETDSELPLADAVARLLTSGIEGEATSDQAVAASAPAGAAGGEAVAVLADGDPARWREWVCGSGPPSGPSSGPESGWVCGGGPGSGRVCVVFVLAEHGECAGTDDEPRLRVEQAVARMGVLRAVVTACDELPPAVERTLYVVTRPSGALPAPELPLVPADAAIWGAARAIANDRPGLRLPRISLHREGTVAVDARRLARELLAASGESEVALTPGGRFVAREVPYEGVGDRVRHYVLDLGRSGRRGEPAWTEADPPPPPGPGTVTVEVRAVGLPDRPLPPAVDSRAAWDAGDAREAGGAGNPWDGSAGSPGDTGPGDTGPGDTGPGDTGPGDARPGDARPGNGDPGDGSPRDARDVSEPGWAFAGVVRAVGTGVRDVGAGRRVVGVAAGVPASHLLADARLVGAIPHGMSFAEAATLPIPFIALARHEARGGATALGLAALQDAWHRGTPIAATARTAAQRELLHGLGVPEALDGPHPGNGAPKTPDSPHPRNGAPEVPNGPHPGDGEPGQGVELEVFREVMERVHAGVHRPLPHTLYPAARVREAVASMRHDRHLGAVVLSFDPLDGPVPVRTRPGRLRPDPGGTYLVVGGVGGFGAAAAYRLAERGARHFALVSRRGGDAPEAAATVAGLRSRRARASVHAADVTDPAAMASVLKEIDAGEQPLRGVVHAAMEPDSGDLLRLEAARLARVLGCKMAGALVLERLTEGRELDLFWLFSSVSGTYGGTRQSAYAAANVFLDALARRRRARGLPGHATAWGTIGDAGFVARHGIAEVFGRNGFLPMTSGEALTAAEGLIAAGVEAGAVSRYDWARCRAALKAGADVATRLRPLID
ncbi:SDR family NAD(P)-dependent oxidoreductase [Nonomuraea sp. NPDC004186]